MLTIPLTLQRVAILGLATAGLLGCGDDSHSAGQGGLSARPPIPEACSIPAAGCPCTGNQPAKCGVTVARQGDTLTCREGERACTDGAWSDCVGNVTTQIYAPPPTPSGVHAEALAPTSAACNDACDPYCQKLADTPDDLTVSKPLAADPTGLSLYSAGFTGGNCPAVAIKPPGAKLEIHSINETDGTVSPSTVTLTAACGAAATPVDPTWGTDQPDRSTVGDDGVLHVFSGVAGDINVSASSLINTATQVVPVTVNINELDTGVDATIQTAFGGVGTITDPAKTLYPYRDTVFPLDLKAPLVQWLNQATAALSKATPVPDNVQVALRYPAGSTAPIFWYSKIFRNEPYDGVLVTNPAAKTAAPAWSVPQAVWEAFSRTAKGKTGEIVIQRSAGPTLYKEMVIPVTFATKALRGTVYYTQYLRRLFKPAEDVCDGQPNLPATYDPLQPGTQICAVGNCTHATDVFAGSTTRSIDMSTSKAVNLDPFNNEGGCPVCHSVSANGNRYVAGSQFLQVFGAPQVAPGTSTGFVSDITATPSGAAKFTVVGEAPNYASNRIAQDWDSRGFAYAPLTPDGALALQGPYSWGNTQDGTVTNNLQTDRAYTSGGQIAPMFLVPTVNPGRSVQFATTTALSATRSGDILTESSGGPLPSIDGSSLAVGDSLLVKDQVDPVDNGLYTVTALGDNCASTELTTSTGLTATATSTTQAASNAFDNDTGTRWETGYSDPQSLTIDLGATQSIGRVRIDWEVASAKTYTVNVATNAGGPWTTIVTVTNNTSSTNHRIDDHNCLSATGRYVRMTGTARTTGYGYSIYEMDVYAPAPGGTPYKLTRRSDARTPAIFDGQIFGGSEVRVTRGNANYSKVFKLTLPAAGVVEHNTDSLIYTNTGADPLPVMMTPTISPDGSKIAYVNGNADTYPTSDSAAWRKSLTMVSVDQATRTISEKKRLLNNWVAGTGGNPIKWPFFESDSRSLMYVQSTEDAYCHSQNSTDDDGRACLESVYGNAAPTTRGHWKGSLFSLDTGAANPAATAAELSKLNDAEDPQDADKSYQPTVLKDESGGYRWVIFTSPRSYGNQFNQIGTHFTCGATMLWVAAIDPQTADGTDRSHPAFFLPGQNVAAITTEKHFVNERGYLVPSPCKAYGYSCSTSDECCGTSQCKVDTISSSGVPNKVCKAAGSCGQDGDACLTSADCCGGGSTPCVAQKCVSVPNYTQSGTYARDYAASCKPGFKPRWGLFSFHLTTPTDSSIVFSAQTATKDTDLPTATPVALVTSKSDNYGAGPAQVDVGAKLEASQVQFSLAYLRIAMVLNPSTNGAFAPVLHDWEQRYSCVPAE